MRNASSISPPWLGMGCDGFKFARLGDDGGIWLGLIAAYSGELEEGAFDR